MAEQPSFRDLIARVRAGDDDATAEVIARYGPYVRRVVRVKLNDVGLGSSSDICQSVLANFFVRAALGAFHLDTPDDLKHLLAAMARNKVRERIRKQRRSIPLKPSDSGAGIQVEDPGSSPSQAAVFHELYQRAVGLLSAEERHLAGQRRLGRPWAEIAAELGQPADALRMRLNRAIDRVVQELGLEVSTDGNA